MPQTRMTRMHSQEHLLYVLTVSVVKYSILPPHRYKDDILKIEYCAAFVLYYSFIWNSYTFRSWDLNEKAGIIVFSQYLFSNFLTLRQNNYHLPNLKQPIKGYCKNTTSYFIFFFMIHISIKIVFLFCPTLHIMTIMKWQWSIIK